MIRRLIIAAAIIAVPSAAICESWNITGLVVDAPARTDERWLAEYLGLNFPTQIDAAALAQLRSKLLTTDVFLEASLIPTRLAKDSDEFILTVQLKEKWTTIPVIRGAFGGGTPLRVFGVYDTHSFGSLWTLGAETRKYGDAPNSYVVWARAPRWRQGHHFLNFELWKQNRIRSFYDRTDLEFAQVTSRANQARFTYLHPIRAKGLGENQGRTLQAGMDIVVRSERPASLRMTTPESAPEDTLSSLYIPDHVVTETSVLPTLVYDSIDIFGIRKAGIRSIVSAGMLVSDRGNSPQYVMEGFGYKIVGVAGNLATHWFLGATRSNALSSQYFLGGLDSVRGLPDGAIFGSQAAYANIEYRQMLAMFDYTWWQGAVFVDSGCAGIDSVAARANARSSAGIGIRIAVPQVYRLMLRVDYAWSLDRPGTSGVSIGLNQFFQPHRPL